MKLIKRVKKVAAKSVRAVTAPVRFAEREVKAGGRAVAQAGRFVDLSAKSSGVRQAAVNLDQRVGGAEGWSKVTAVVAKAVKPIPVVGEALSVSFSTVSGVTAAEAQKQAAAKSAAIKAAGQTASNPGRGARILRFIFPR